MTQNCIECSEGAIEFIVDLDKLTKEELIDLVKRYYNACKDTGFTIKCAGGTDEGCSGRSTINNAMLFWYNHRLCAVCSDCTDGDKFSHVCFGGVGEERENPIKK